MDAVPTARREAKKVGNIDDIMAETSCTDVILLEQKPVTKQFLPRRRFVFIGACKVHIYGYFTYLGLLLYVIG